MTNGHAYTRQTFAENYYILSSGKMWEGLTMNRIRSPRNRAATTLLGGRGVGGPLWSGKEVALPGDNHDCQSFLRFPTTEGRKEKNISPSSIIFGRMFPLFSITIPIKTHNQNVPKGATGRVLCWFSTLLSHCETLKSRGGFEMSEISGRELKSDLPWTLFTYGKLNAESNRGSQKFAWEKNPC